MIKRRINIILVFLFSVVSLNAQPDYGIPDKPSPARLVNDWADILSPGEEKELEQTLVDYANRSTAQVVVLTVTDFNGFAKEEYAFGVMDKWGIGQKKSENGLLILIRPEVRNNEHHGDIFIATGPGLEGSITDVKAKRIIEDEMIPFFKQGNYHDGILIGVNECLKLAQIDFPEKEVKSLNSRMDKWKFLIGLVFIIVFWIFYMRRVGNYANRNHLSWWTAFWMISRSGRSHGGYWGNFNSGGGGFGGFGGFGGGRSGGGGAGGSW